MTGYTVRLADLRPFRSRATLWSRIALLMFGAPGRVWSLSEIADHLYADQPDGGPECAAMLIRVIISRKRHTLPRGWTIRNVFGRGYVLGQAEPRRQRRLHAKEVPACAL